ncbi:efflux RND transporter permease subunit [Halapricum desulfuricans]|uniref:Putative exporter of the RND superfamily n=1 Tax=Halapricum desulfuricans TaxID=2841257 RepID=A0A897NFK5_9EURY|nr:MMPL family transporter [Halapricum desulfuricans]QSG10215.1 putative exporter of the RND superfamily [Halapricum desulfuricans]
MSARGRIDAWVERVTGFVTERPRVVIVGFLLITAVFAGGMGQVSMGSSDQTESFTEGIPEQEALDSINEEFQGPFEADTPSTQLIHESENVLSQSSMLEMLRLLERIDQREELYVASTAGPAPAVAQALDPTATTPEQQQRAIRRASETEFRKTVSALAERPGFSRSLSDDFNAREGTASAAITVVTHSPPDQGDHTEEIQTTIQSLAGDGDATVYVLGDGIVQSEMNNVINDSLAIVMPLVVVLILGFLAVAYRDPIDMLLGLIALAMTIVWTFGFVGFAGIPFDMTMITVPVLLLAVGVDFGIHIINRYREETVIGREKIPSMRVALSQLLVAFVIVAITTLFGFAANISSDLEPIRRMGFVAGIGILFTFFIFGIFLPAAKIESDRFRDRYNVPEFDNTPVSSGDSVLGRVLAVPARITNRAPAAVVVAVLLVTAGTAVYGAGVDNTFETEDFLPPEEQPDVVENLPGDLAPSEYTMTATYNFVEDNFETATGEEVILYVEGPFEQAHALDSLVAPNDDPPEPFAVGEHGRAESESIVTVIQSYAEENPEFAALVARNDLDDDGIPDRNLVQIYDELDRSPYGDRASEYLTEDRRGAKVSYSVDAEASQGEIEAAGRTFADDFQYEATATGNTIVFGAVSDIVFESSIQSLALAIGLSGVFLIVVYWLLEGRPMLGVINTFPIIVAVVGLLATMRALGMALNAVTATILSIALGVGIAYSVHVIHRYVDEVGDGTGTQEALLTTLTGTGGALTGSMATTSLGTGALAFAISPVLGDFGFLMAISVFYSFATSIIVLPPTVQAYAQWDGYPK